MASSRSVERREVAGEQREERIADAVEGGRAPLPDALDVDVEDVAPEVVDLEVALEARLGRQPGRIDRLDGCQVGPVRGDLAEDRVALAVGEPAILGVDPDERREVRVVADDPPEARLDEVVEALVERTAVGGGPGPGQGEGFERGRLTAVLPDGRSGSRSSVRPRGRGRRLTQGGGDGSEGRIDVVRRRSRSGSPRGPDRGDIPPSGRSVHGAPSRNAARERVTRNRTKFVATRSGSKGPRPGCAMSPAATIPGSSARPPPAGGRCAWSSARRSIMPAGPSRRAISPGAARTPAWRIPPPTSLRARRARSTNVREPTTTEPTGQARPLLRQNVTESAGAASSRAGVPRATTALKSRAPSTWSGTPRSWAIAGDPGRVRGVERLAHRVGVGVLEGDERRSAARARSFGSRNAVRDLVGVERAVGPLGELADRRPDDDRVAGRLVDHQVVLAAGDRLLAASQVSHRATRGCPASRW